MIKFDSSGDWSKTRSFLNRMVRGDNFDDLDAYGKMGVEALARATPVETGLTQSDWYYVIKKEGKRPTIEWHNNNMVDGIPVVILIQYGHGTGTGGYVQGRDFINPAILPVFDQIANEIWKKVTA